jgi:hypothetical protein
MLSHGSQNAPPDKVCPAKLGKERHKMSKHTDNSFFIVSSGLGSYQQLLSGIRTFRDLANRLLSEIRAAHSFRQTDRVRELSTMLLRLPIKEYQSIAKYYLVWCDCRELKLHTDVLEAVIEQSQAYKAKGLVARAAHEALRGNIEPMMYFYAEALKASPNVSEYVDTVKAISAVKSVEGFHELALKDLESLIPITKHAEPFVYFDFLNSYAVELGEAGRKYEARNISRIVLASPFIHAYPEWQETAQYLKEPKRSFVAVPQIERKQVEIEPHHASESHPSATIISFPQLKEAPQPKIPEQIKPQELGDMTLAEKREFIMAAVRSGAIGESDYTKMIINLGLLESSPVDNVLDLEDEALLDDLIIEWSHLVEPEKLAAVLSTLRDCEDSIRQRNILDRMIRIAFEQTQVCGITEDEWRLRVERRLPEK